MKRSPKMTLALMAALFLSVITTVALAAPAPCPPPPMSAMNKSDIEDLLTDYLAEMSIIYQECSNPAADLLRQLDDLEKNLRDQAKGMPKGRKRGAIEAYLKEKLIPARAGVAKFDISQVDPCKTLKDRLDRAKAQLKAGGYPDEVAAMKAVHEAAAVVCPKGALSLVIRGQEKVFDPRVSPRDPAFNAKLDAEQLAWQDAQAIAGGALEALKDLEKILGE